MTDIVESLRFGLRDWDGKARTHFPSVNALTVAEAADAIERLQAELAEAEEREKMAWRERNITGALLVELAAIRQRTDDAGR